MITNENIRTNKYSVLELTQDYKIFECIGRDTLSAAFKAKDNRTGELVTLLFLRNLVNEVQYRKEFIQLITTVSLLKHPLILPIKKAYVPFSLKELHPNQIERFSQFNLSPIILTSYIANGQLSIHTKRYLKSEGRINQKLNPTVRSKVIFGVASLMQYLHNLKIEASTLKFEKIYLNGKLEPLFVNVGFDFYCPLTVDVEYIPPFTGNDRFKNEVYQFGVFLYKMFSFDERGISFSN